MVIPVIDLMGGVVVRAKMGARHAYRPIETPLSPTADPVDVVAGLLTLASFSTFYIADLDAILRRGDNVGSLFRLRKAFPGLQFWIDCGASDIAAIDFIRPFGESILGSESQDDIAFLESQRNVVLSLDFKGDHFVGPADILARPDIWPDRVIVMNLMRIGAGIGPDFERLRVIRALSGSRKLFAAGGVRGPGDFVALKDFGVEGVLVASALHDGRLRPKDLEHPRKERRKSDVCAMRGESFRTLTRNG